MRSLQEYVDLIARVVEYSEAESAEIDVEQDPTAGKVKGALYFRDGSRLEFTETVTLERYRPVKLYYVYQYISGGEAIFRYDNAPHHPELFTFPHHKHVGKARLPATEPTLSHVVSEVAALLSEKPKGPSGRPKRRRRTKR